MGGYVARRLLLLPPVLLGVLTVVFVLMRAVPGDPARLIAGPEATQVELEAVRREWGLDAPLPVQYLQYLSRVARGDLGESIRSRRPVTVELAARFPNTLQLALASLLIMTVLGVSVGIVAATHQNTFLDYASMTVALVGISMPVFWLGLMLMLLFSLYLGWLPATGKDGLAHVILPAITLGTALTAVVARITRASMLEVLRQDYIRTARAKGLSERLVVWAHALRNALIPTVTVVGLNFGGLLSGAVLTETVFAWPGIGRLIVDAIEMRDYAIVQGGVLLVALTYSLVNLIVDVAYAFIDPRIRYG
ncbi:MAG: ABC transporter permease [Armatimonadota bacterium]|nr:ABC transporter permease [Armatimonadota bacterium]MDR7451645.1 ABC transporter permease [Armatimonadota bacterium]MDR7467635.1 ABC transporter permease [Armatimonadota bacterium]MDR7492614.1 ABC transporter permease [Armatimonadota bacterium]MDR7499918.1 ABC transporter permease [Armatimonadota bacterium]